LTRYLLPTLACLTLGLAPFWPEPHVAGKLRWVAGGARGMGLVDWFDLVFHGTPWVWLAATLLAGAMGLARPELGRRRRGWWGVGLAVAGAGACVAYARFAPG